MTGDFLRIHGIYEGTGIAKSMGRCILYLDDRRLPPNTQNIYKGSGMAKLMGRKCILYLDECRVADCRVPPNTQNIHGNRNG